MKKCIFLSCFVIFCSFAEVPDPFSNIQEGLNVQVLGICQDDTLFTASIKENGVIRVVRAGDRISSGWTVTAITAREVSLALANGKTWVIS